MNDSFFYFITLSSLYANDIHVFQGPFLVDGVITSPDLTTQTPRHNQLLVLVPFNAIPKQTHFCMEGN